MRPVKRPFHQTQTPSDPPRSRQRLSGPAAATTPADPAPTSSANAPPDIMPSRRPSSSQLRRQMVNFAPEVWDKIASYDLSEADITSITNIFTSHFNLRKSLKIELEPRLQSKRYAHQASQINSLAEMNTLLQQIGRLRQDVQWEPLYQVMLRVRALPRREDQAAGLRSYKAAVDALPLECHPCELDLIFNHAHPSSAIYAGQRVDTVARLFNITRLDEIRELEKRTTGSYDPRTAGGAMRAGGHVRKVAEKFGITTDEGILELENITTCYDGKARSAMIAGGQWQTVAEQFGVTSTRGIEALESTAAYSEHPGTAGAAMIAGGKVQTVAQQFDITSIGGIEQLEVATAKSIKPGTAGAAMNAGGHVQTVAQQFGITSTKGIEALELATIYPARHNWLNFPEVEIIPGTAQAAMMAGGDVRTVAQQFGITTEKGIEALESVTANSKLPGTAGAAMIAGGHVQIVAQKFGITTCKGIHDLCSTSWNSGEPGTVGAAVKTGVNLQTIAQDFGLPSDFLWALEVSALWDGPAFPAVIAGGNVNSIMQQFGFTYEHTRFELEFKTIHSDEPGTAGAAIRAGSDVQTVAQQFGITTVLGLEKLAERFSGIRR